QTVLFRYREDMTVQKQIHPDTAVLMAAFGRIDVPALAVAMGTVCAIAFLLLTATLLLKGAPPDTQIGPRLGLLSLYLPGYSVSWSGSVVGAAYGWIIGAGIGFLWAVLWNMTHYVYIILVVARAHWWRMMAD
ncbi:MAG: hypothetical protein ABI648_15305, partial [Betaproteobacteria bacterium]